MKFISNDVHGVFEYDFSDNVGWSEKVKNYYNKGDVIDVNFDVVIETHFTADFLNGKFVPLDAEAKEWAVPLMALNKYSEDVAVA